MIRTLSFIELQDENYLESFQGRRIIDCLTSLKAAHVVLEDNYIDWHYMIDYSKFHSRSFSKPKIETTRLHFFRDINFEEEDFDGFFKSILADGNAEKIKELQKAYIGFCVEKPIKNEQGKKVIGRTIIDPHNSIEKPDDKVFLVTEKKSSLCGIPLNINGLPYQAQDRMVCACATVSIWTCLHSLNRLFGVKIFSPCEITEGAVTTPSIYRSFPSSSLTLEQMISFLKSLKLDCETITLDNNEEEARDLIEAAVKAYLNAGIPIILGLKIKKEDKPDGNHAVVVSGYKLTQGQISELYIHDDGISPYSVSKPINNSFVEFENDWSNNLGFSIRITDLIIPVYPKIRLNFLKMHKLLKKHEENNPFAFELYLTELKEYKKFLLTQKIKDKENILCKSLPRFIWIIRSSYSNKTVFDRLYDGTSVFPIKVADIDYL